MSDDIFKPNSLHLWFIEGFPRPSPNKTATIACDSCVHQAKRKGSYIQKININFEPPLPTSFPSCGKVKHIVCSQRNACLGIKYRHTFEKHRIAEVTFRRHYCICTCFLQTSINILRILNVSIGKHRNFHVLPRQSYSFSFKPIRFHIKTVTFV